MALVGLVHGIGGSATTMQPLADLLLERGHEVIVVTLPGHGTVPDDLVGVGWSDWLAAVPDAEVLVGQSMGASLALAASIHNCNVRSVVAINPPTADPDALEGLEWRRSRGHKWVDMPERVPTGALIEMVEGVLALDVAKVVASVLLVTGALDDTADPSALDELAASLGGRVQRCSLPNSGHVATLGPDIDLLADAIHEFV